MPARSVRQDFKAGPAFPNREETAYQSTSRRRSARRSLEVADQEVRDANRLPRAAQKPATVRRTRASVDWPRAEAARDTDLTEIFGTRTFAAKEPWGRRKARIIRGKIYQGSSIEARGFSVQVNTETTFPHASVVVVPLGCPPMERHATQARAVTLRYRGGCGLDPCRPYDGALSRLVAPRHGVNKRKAGRESTGVFKNTWDLCAN
jgi:hypothetical protein